MLHFAVSIRASNRLIEMFCDRSHTFVAILTKEGGRLIVFESGGASLVFIEHDPERSIKSCSQSCCVICEETSRLPMTYYAALRLRHEFATNRRVSRRRK